MKQIILVMGLSGAGKSTLALALLGALADRYKSVFILNADQVRGEADDWDFSKEGRIRQAHRMYNAAMIYSVDYDYVICDLIAPYEEMRKIIDPGYTIWVNTIKKSRFEDTDLIFTPPVDPDFMIVEQDAAKWVEVIACSILDNRQ